MKTSEYVALGHPDKLADYIASKILDYLSYDDPKTRAGIEVQLKDDAVVIAGEVTSLTAFDQHKVEELVVAAFNEVGYTAPYAEAWNRVSLNISDPRKLKVIVNLSKQSGDIAQGVDKNGWGDQGVYFNYANTESKYEHERVDYYAAKKLGQFLYEMAKADDSYTYGIDIKTLVTVDGDEADVTIAIPTNSSVANGEDAIDVIRNKASDFLAENFPELTIKAININTTGAYVKHGPVADAGVCGRKIVVDAHGGASKVGGGNLWGKDISKSDVSLNVLSRIIAVEKAKEFAAKSDGETIEVFVDMSGKIGKNEVQVEVVATQDGEVIDTQRYALDYGPEDLRADGNENGMVKAFLSKSYCERCKEGIYSKAILEF